MALKLEAEASRRRSGRFAAYFTIFFSLQIYFARVLHAGVLGLETKGLGIGIRGQISRHSGKYLIPDKMFLS